MPLRLAGECAPIVTTHMWGSPAFRPLPVRLAQDGALLVELAHQLHLVGLVGLVGLAGLASLVDAQLGRLGVG